MKIHFVISRLLAVLLLTFLSLGSTRAFAELPKTAGLMFLKHPLAGTFDSVGKLDSCDLDGDLDQDVIASLTDGGVYKMVWWENDGTPGNGIWTKHDIGSTSNYISGYAVADLDGDLDLDVVVTVNNASKMLYFENDGSPADGGWVERSIWTGKPFRGLALADLDKDLDMDVIVITNYNIDLNWYENDGAPADGGWKEHKLWDWCDECELLKIVDINQDTWLDVIITADDDNLQDYDTLYFLTNNGAGGWTKSTLEKSANMEVPDAGDMDGDGDVDLVVSTESGWTYWYENNGGAASTWVVVNVGYTYNRIVFDLDGDNDLDIFGSSYKNNEIAWFENDGTPLDPGWTRYLIDGAESGVGSANAGDLDGDSDMDVFAKTGSGIYWYEQTSVLSIFLPFISR